MVQRENRLKLFVYADARADFGVPLTAWRTLLLSQNIRHCGVVTSCQAG